jgi:hypothetical protein
MKYRRPTCCYANRVIVFAFVIFGCFHSKAQCMELKVIENQLILSGKVVAADPEWVRDALAAAPWLNTVILRNSPGGDAPAGYRIGELVREKGLRTAVSGFCYSSCSRMFLGGRTRFFTDDFTPEATNVGFHGHYAGGRLNAPYVAKLGLRDWIIRYSDGKADPALVERWINIPFARGMAHFFYPGLVNHGGFSTFICQGTESSADIFSCEPIAKTAFELGIITSLEIVHSADRALAP